ncbi:MULTISPECIES: hypothetical protein [unclassified Microcoleus]|nr:MULTISPECIES: hypothetical protein [unclassified Microcoleus]
MGHGAWGIFAFIELGRRKEEQNLPSSFASGFDITPSPEAE